ncbi:hypothetical protein DL770_011331 [Monosporascus sp. CRB-9-2]|nr:hypothetical protein DL770_011331 [Monosporascus sp. CRB-9-2]
MAAYSPPIPAPRGQDVDAQRDEEQLAAAESIGHPAEQQRAEHRADQVRAAGNANLRVGEMQGRALLERARHRAGQRHLQAVEQPRNAQCNDHARVKAAPGQAIEPAGQV